MLNDFYLAKQTYLKMFDCIVKGDEKLTYLALILP